MSSALVLSWLVLCHLLADFVLQPERVAVDKFGRGPEAWRALLIHTGIVTVVASPIILVYGVAGVGYVLVTAISHLVIDRTKIEFTLRGGSVPGVAPDEAAGEPVQAWSPMPAAWFLLDQLLHLAVLVAAWAILLRHATPLDWWQDLVRQIGTTRSAGDVGRTFHGLLVLASLVIVNVRAGSCLSTSSCMLLGRRPTTRRGLRTRHPRRASDPPSASSSGCSSALWCWRAACLPSAW